MNNPFEWLDLYESDRIFAAQEEYSEFSDYYSEYASQYDLTAWYEYLTSLSPLKLNERSKILDLGCGTGDMLMYFLNDGMFVVGVDYSQRMLDAAEDNIFLSDDGYYRYILMNGDISGFYLSAKFDFIYSMGDTVNYLSLEKLRKLLKNVRRMLKNGAVFTFDAINPSHFVLEEQMSETVNIDEETKITFKRTLKYYEDGLYLDTHFDITDYEEKVISSEDHHQRVFTSEEICDISGECGLLCEKVPFLDDSDDSEKMQFVLKVK